MLPFGAPQGYLGQPNLFANAQTQMFVQQMQTANAALLNNQMLARIPTPHQPHPSHSQPMMIAPGILNEVKTSNSEPGLTPSTNSPAVGGNAAGEWTEHIASDGRVYYYNKAKKLSSWTKPEELKTPQEREKSQWKEYKTPEGKPYYYNTLTKITTWSKPTSLEKEIKRDPEQPELIHISSNSELERAMEATLKKLEKKDGASEKAAVKEAKTKEVKSERKEIVNEENADEYELNLKKRQIEKFKELLRDKCNDRRINTSQSWEQACKYIQHDPRFKILGKVSERKQVFNAWKIQRSKEERDERRLAIKKAKEDLEKWLMNHPKMKSTLRYQKADSWFSSEHSWRTVSDAERREIFHDVSKAVAKREEENKKTLRERNIKALADILDGIQEIDYRTTWAQAQRILIENPDFANDSTLQGMDKEDALVVFQQHIKAAEELYSKEKQQEAKRIKRQERKVREAFLLFLQELHDREILTSVSTWSGLFPTISVDERFENMLNQPGSTALDLFKFYVEDLKNQYYEDRRVIKEILKEREAIFTIFTTSTSFDQFQKWIKSDERGKNVDIGNLRLCFNSLFDKVLEKQKEAEREVHRMTKRRESTFWSLLRKVLPPIDPITSWEEIRDQIKDTEEYLAGETEEQRRQFFTNYIKSIAEACGHHHGSSSSKKKKKDKKKKKKREQQEDSDSESIIRAQKKSSKKRHAAGEDESPEVKKSKKSKRHSPPPTSDSSHSEGELVERREFKVIKKDFDNESDE